MCCKLSHTWLNIDENQILTDFTINVYNVNLYKLFVSMSTENLFVAFGALHNTQSKTRIVCIRPKGRTQCIFPRSQHSCLYVYIY